MDARPKQRFTSLKEFYPYYLTEQRRTSTRMLRFIGTTLILLWIVLAAVTGNAWWLMGVPLGGYGYAWAGHAFSERNKPATFRFPLYSLASDFILFWQLLSGKESFRS